MNETYDLANHLVVVAYIVFYWHLLRIWHQPPPSASDDNAGEKKPAAGLDAKLASVALRQLAAPSADAARQPSPAPAAPPADSLAAIHAADEWFDEKSFLAGAAIAYELIVNAYAKQDTQVLEKLLDPEAAGAFVDAIAARKARGERTTLTFIGIKDMEIVCAWAQADLAEISVRFTSEAVTVTYGADGAIIDGDPAKVLEMTDQWTFARCFNSKDPNWKLVATEGG